MDYVIYTAVFIALFAVLAWRDFMLAFLLFCALLPSYLLRFNLGPLPTTALEAMLAVLVIRYACELGRDRQAWRLAWQTARRSSFFAPGLVLVTAALISSLITDDQRAALGIWRAYFVEPVIVYALAINIVKTSEQWKKVFIALGAAVVALTLFALYQYFTGEYLPTWEWTDAATRRATSVFTSPNSLALFVVPVALVFAGWRPSWHTKFSHVVVDGALVALLVGWSKGGMAALLAGGLFIAYQQFNKRLAVLTGMVLMCLALALPNTRALLRFDTASGQSRLALYEGSIKLLKQSPLLGTGLAGFGSAFESVRPAAYTEKLIYPHNIALNFWLETGLLGLLAVLWVVVILIRQFLTTSPPRPALQIGLAAAFIAIFVHGLVDVPYFKNDLAMLVWLLLAAWYTNHTEIADKSV